MKRIHLVQFSKVKVVLTVEHYRFDRSMMVSSCQASFLIWTHLDFCWSILQMKPNCLFYWMVDFSPNLYGMVLALHKRLTLEMEFLAFLAIQCWVAFSILLFCHQFGLLFVYANAFVFRQRLANEILCWSHFLTSKLSILIFSVHKLLKSDSI